MLSAAVRAYHAAVTIRKVDTPPVDCKSVLSIVSLDVQDGDVCEIAAEGSDAAAALEAARMCVEELIAHGEEPPPPLAPARTVSVPRELRHAANPVCTGRGVSPGVAIGPAVVVSPLAISKFAQSATSRGAAIELHDAQTAVSAVATDLQHRAATSRIRTEAELLAAHAQIASDPALWSRIASHINTRATAPQAVLLAATEFADQLRHAASEYIRERAIDVHDVCTQILTHLKAIDPAATKIELSQPSIIVADLLTPSQLLATDRSHIAGLLLGAVGVTSHTVILARSMGIPAVIDVPSLTTRVRTQQTVALDGEQGIAALAADSHTVAWFERRRSTLQRAAATLLARTSGAAATADGVRIELAINASRPEEVTAAIAHGAEGVGLLRTELLFLDRDEEPTEDEQFAAYASVVRAAAGKSVIIRTFDIGGDKPARYLPMPREENPFLGQRGVRLYPKHIATLRRQLRAILRASALGPVKIMAPMVSLPSEARWFREEVRGMQAQLATAGIAFDMNTRIGVMVEVPALALVIDQLAPFVEFISIGTNDLCQYSFAVDRGNPAVAPLYNACHPAFLRLLKTIVTQARTHSLWVGICGEMASDVSLLPLLTGMGFSELSVSASELTRIKSTLGSLHSTACQQLLSQCCSAADAPAVRELLQQATASAASPRPLIDEALINIASLADSKARAIREAADLLCIDNRTPDVQALEDAIWAREETYSTGLGHGFAIPHCKSAAVTNPTLAVLKLNTPISWGSLDDQPVHTVLLLAIPAAASANTDHMKIFAKLARKLMHEDFREQLQTATSGPQVASLLREHLSMQ
jgi:fructose-specific PTS system IIA-like component